VGRVLVAGQEMLRSVRFAEAVVEELEMRVGSCSLLKKMSRFLQPSGSVLAKLRSGSGLAGDLGGTCQAC